MIFRAWSEVDVQGDGRLLLEKLSSCTAYLKSWSAVTFGNIPRRIIALSKEVEKLNNLPSWADHKARLLKVEKELDGVLALEEYYYKQRSRTEWLKGGDRNTKFSHSKV